MSGTCHDLDRWEAVLRSLDRRAAPAITAAGANVRILPPYSPDFHPIRKAFSRLKAKLRTIARRTLSGLWDLTGKRVDIFQPVKCAKRFRSCGYDSD